MFWLLSIIAILAFTVGPMLVQYNHWSLGYRGSGDWLSFWGSYLGIIPSGIIASLVASNQIKESNKQSEKNRLQEIDRISQSKIMENWYEVRQSLITIKLLTKELDTETYNTHDQFVAYMLSENGQVFEHNNYQEIRIQFNSICRIISIINIDSDEKKLNELLNSLQKDFSLFMRWAQLCIYKESPENFSEQIEDIDNLIDEQFKMIRENGISSFLSDIDKLLGISKEEILKIRNN